MGSLYWQLNDCWPVASWSSTDYYRNYKALHYYVRKAFKPVVVLTTLTDDSIEFQIVSDRQDKLRATLNIKVLSLAGKVISDQNQIVKIDPSGNVVVASLPLKTLLQGNPADETVIAATLLEKDVPVDRCLTYLVKPKKLHLSKAAISIQTQDGGTEWLIRISADRVVKNLMITYNGRAGIFSDNYFDLLPGETAVIRLAKTWSPANPKPDLELKSLVETMN